MSSSCRKRRAPTSSGGSPTRPACRTAIASQGRSLAFISRVPMASHRWVRPLFSQHAFLEVVLEGHDVRIFGVHLSAVHAAWTERGACASCDRCCRRSTRVLADVSHRWSATSTRWRRTSSSTSRSCRYRLRVLVWLSGGRIRWQTIAIMLGAGYVDAFRVCDPTGDGLTFPTWDPHVRLDYAFVPKAFADRLESCAVVRENPDVKRASDHFPLRISFRS